MMNDTHLTHFAGVEELLDERFAEPAARLLPPIHRRAGTARDAVSNGDVESATSSNGADGHFALVDDSSLRGSRVEDAPQSPFLSYALRTLSTVLLTSRSSGARAATVNPDQTK